MNRSTLIAVFLLLGLGSWYYFYEFKGSTTRLKAKEDAKLVFKGFDETAVQEVLIHQGTGNVALKRISGNWQMTYPVKYGVDSTVMNTLLDTLRDMKQEDVVDEMGNSLNEFGLASPTTSVAFATGPNSAKTILFGIDNPTGEDTYAKVQGEVPVFMVTRINKLNVTKGENDLRDKTVFGFQPPQVVSLKSSFGKGLAFELDKKGSWNLTAPFQEHGNHDGIFSWLQQLSSLRINTFVDDEGKHLAKYGLNSPEARMTITVKDQKEPIVLDEGKKVPGNNQGRYYRIEGKPLVFTMADYVSAIFEKKTDDLVDRQAFAFQPYQIKSFEVTRDGKTMRAVNTNSVWAWDPPLSKTAGTPDFNFLDFLSEVSAAKLTARLPDSTKMDHPTMVVTFRGDDNAAIEKVTVGATDAKGLEVFSMAKNQAVDVATDLFSKLPK